MTNISKSHKLMRTFGILSIILLLLCITSFILTTKNSPMGIATVTSQGTLSSYQLEDNKYFGLYRFTYIEKDWTYLSQKGYRDAKDIPTTLSITHNKFTSLDNMHTYSDSSIFFYAPFIYALALLLCGSLFFTYRSRYKNLLLLEQTKTTIIDDEI